MKKKSLKTTGSWENFDSKHYKKIERKHRNLGENLTKMSEN